MTTIFYVMPLVAIYYVLAMVTISGCNIIYNVLYYAIYIRLQHHNLVGKTLFAVSGHHEVKPQQASKGQNPMTVACLNLKSCLQKLEPPGGLGPVFRLSEPNF